MDELLNYAGGDGWMSMDLGPLVRSQRRIHFDGRHIQIKLCNNENKIQSKRCSQ